ncbi:hypothetical protein ACI2OX_21995 [Bacillus sp. N9]
MYIHVGENIMVRADEMIVMLTKESVQASKKCKSGWKKDEYDLRYC